MANHKKRFCLNNHDTNIVGRTPRNGCKQCTNERSQKWYASNTVKAKASIKKWADANKEYRKDQEYRRTYGITLADYKVMVAQQEGRCRICAEYKALVVDHCHKTGTIRGLLCSQCNRAMGLFQDDPAKIGSALIYLEQTA
jgi:hypothetical protein